MSSDGRLNINNDGTALAKRIVDMEVEVVEPILGFLLTNPDFVLSQLSIKPSDLSSFTHKVILEGIYNSYSDGFGIDIGRVSKYCTNNGVNNSELVRLMDNINHTVGIELFIKKYKEYISRKKVFELGNAMMTKAVGGLNPGDVVDYANSLLDTISNVNSSYDIKENVGELMDYIQEREGKTLVGYSFGDEFEMLDRVTRGVQPGRTYRVGAPSNMGKTQWVYGVINNLVDQGAKVAFFSLENDKDFTLSNLLANRQRINSHDMESGKVAPSFEELEKLYGKLFVIDDTHELSEIFSRIISIKPDVVILDYIGLVTIGRTGENELFTEYAKRVQQFVKKTRVGWIDLSNLPIGVDDDEILARGQFYGSSYLRNNADVGLHLIKYEPFYKVKSMKEADADHRKRLNTDIDYRLKWTSKKAIRLAVTKNRIGPAMIDESYYINFAEGARFRPIPPEDKLTFEL